MMKVDKDRYSVIKKKLKEGKTPYKVFKETGSALATIEKSHS